MGKATRWLKSLLGLKREKQTPIPPPNQNNKKEKRRWSFTNPRNDDSAPPPRRISLNIPPEGGGESAWLRNYLSEKDDNQAIAMAEATAAAAEAAIAAAQAAMVVVRLGNRRRSSGAGRERWAAVNIQTVFRGYLARKALKALKGLVKLQAYVRGYLVRKRAAATLHSMQALIRAQTTARFLAKTPLETQSRISEDEFQSKRMSDSCYDDNNPKIVEIDTYKPKSIKPNNYTFTSEYGDHDMHTFSMSGPIGGPFLTPARLSVSSRHNECGTNDERQFRRHRRNSTAHCTSRFGNWADGPFTSGKPIWDDGPFRAYCHPDPGYMASTQSFEAKSRSQSAPKQRLPQPSPSKKKMPLEKVMECRHSLSGVRMNRSYSEDRGGLHF